MRELLSKVKRIGIESGVVEIRLYSGDTDHFIGFDFLMKKQVKIVR
jgi:hypothetical protein